MLIESTELCREHQRPQPAEREYHNENVQILLWEKGKGTFSMFWHLFGKSR